MQTYLSAGLVCLVQFAGGSAAFAGESSEAVRPFYLQPGLELEASERDRFIDPARKILDQNDEIRQSGDEGCLDPALPFNDSKYDPAVVARTLTLREIAVGDQATVLATFMAAGNAQNVQWRLKKVDGAWKVFDIVSMDKDWALSRFQCE